MLCEIYLARVRDLLTHVHKMIILPPDPISSEQQNETWKGQWAERTFAESPWKVFFLKIAAEIVHVLFFHLHLDAS